MQKGENTGLAWAALAARGSLGFGAAGPASALRRLQLLLGPSQQPWAALGVAALPPPALPATPHWVTGTCPHLQVGVLCSSLVLLHLVRFPLADDCN